MNPNWQKTDSFPTIQPDITIIFEGLMALCQRDDNHHFEFACYGNELGHKLILRIDRLIRDELETGIEQMILENTDITFRVLNSTEKDKPLVYQSSIGDTRDFSYIVDIEELQQSGSLNKKPFILANLITVENGLLHTYAPTFSTFTIHDGNNVEVMNEKSVALNIGVNIYLDDQQRGELEIGQAMKIPFEKQNGTQIVRLNNECDCDFDPHSNDPKKRNDFYLNYEHIIDAPETFFKIATVESPPLVPRFARFLALRLDSEDLLGGKDASPCTAYGYGHTGRWR